MFNQNLESIVHAYFHGKLHNAIYSWTMAIIRILAPHVNPRDIANDLDLDQEIAVLVSAIVRQLAK